MASLSSPGIGSNLDVNGIVSKLMSVERLPLDKLDLKDTVNKAKISAYGTLKSALSTFQSSLSSLNSATQFSSLKGTASDSTVASVSVSSTASVGSYSLEVYKLAQSHKIASAGYASADSTIGTGTLTFQFGTDDGAGGFVANSDKSSQTVTIDTAHTSLSGIRDAINEAGIGVTASVINDGSTNGNKLVLTSNDSGAANSLRITTADTGLSAIVYDPTDLVTPKTMTQTQAAQDASLKLDGLAITKASNTITDAINGVTLTLLKQTNAGAVGNPTTVSVARDSTGVSTGVDSFVKAFNSLTSTIGALTAFGGTSGANGVLIGDSSVSRVLSQLRQAMTTPLSGLGSTYTSLSSIGISFQRDGSLAVNSIKLNAAISSSPGDVGALFTTLGNASDNQIEYISATPNTQGGRYSVYVSSLAKLGASTGASVLPATISVASPFVIDDNNDALSVKVNGTQSGTISLTKQSYTSGAALAAEIQSKINSDISLMSVGAAVIVTYDSTNNRLVTTSSAYGPDSKVSYTSADSTTATTLGLGSNALYSLGASVLPPGGFPFTIDSSNKTLSVNVDGNQSGTILLTEQSYASGAALAAEIQSKINADSNLVSAGVAVTVTYDSANNRLVTTSNSSGQSAKVSYTSPATTLGLGLTAGTSTGASVLPADIALTPVVIDDDNKTLSIKVDGNQSGTIWLTKGSYTSGAALAAEIQLKINNDSNLKLAGAVVTVTYDSANNRLVTTSNSYGTSSTVSYTADCGSTTAATLGLSSSNVSTPGTNVATEVGNTETIGSYVSGMINGTEATGLGQYLTGTGGGADGLKLRVLGGAEASERGSVSYSQGYAYQLNNMISSMLSSDGLIASSTDSLNQQIKDTASRRAILNQRLTDTEERYRKQFTALDVTIGNMNTTSQYLTQQLAQLNSVTSTKST